MIETKDTHRSPFGMIAKGTVGGGIIGYAAKHMLPLSEIEMDAEFKGAMATIREQSSKAKASAIDTIRNIKDKTLAQDTFIKMIDTEVTATSNPNMAKALKMKKIIDNAKLNKGDMLELKGIIASVNKKAGEAYKFYSKILVNGMKSKRVTPIYVAAGAVAGFFTGLAQSVFRNNA